MKKILYFLVLVVMVTLIGVVLLNYTQSDLSQEEILKLTEEDLYNYMVDNCTPIGSKKDDVLEFIHNVGYEINNKVKLQFLEDAKGYSVSGEHKKVVARYGNNYIRVHLGEYIDIITDEEGSFPYTCDVTLFWIFDDDELVHINVCKDWDGT